MKRIDSKEELFSIEVEKPSRKVFSKAKERFDRIAKPLDGLGEFETLIARIAAIEGSIEIRTEKRAAVIMCADNGIVDEGISQSGKEITLSVAEALGSSISTACTLGRSCNVDIIPVDIGIDSDKKIPGVMDRKVSRGTENFLNKPAMNEEETLKAVNTGIEIVRDLKDRGFNMLALGEMGIGNTTTATAVLSGVLKQDPFEITGRGAGIDDKGLLRKKEVIKKALDLYDTDSIKDENERAFKILSSVGGLDIAGLTGVIIGGALENIPVVLDGLITSAAAVMAETMVPGVKGFMIASHKGREGGNIIALDHLGLCPFINGNMALGEGTGAIMLFKLIDAAADFYRNARSFDDYKIEEYTRFS